MPLSTYDGRQWAVDRIAATTAPIIVDGGAGMGTYSVLGRHLRWDAHWVGVEIHRPYVERFLLDHLYDEVVVADLRRWPPEPIPARYVILLGDVLEHMTREDAIDVIEYHKAHAEEIMVSIPIVYAPQEGCFGNDHEAHLYHWRMGEMAQVLGRCDTFEGVEVGRFWWRRGDTDAD